MKHNMKKKQVKSKDNQRLNQTNKNQSINKHNYYGARKSDFNYASIIAIIIVSVATIISYFPAINGDAKLTNLDDNLYIKESPYIYSPTKNIFFTDNKLTYYMGNYHPLSMISLAIDFKLGGIDTKTGDFDPWWYHFTNLIFHVLNTLLVFWFVFKLIKLLEGKKLYNPVANKSVALEFAMVAAALFGLHPIHTESVAWVSERKDVLYTFFYMGGLIAYLNFIESDAKRIKYIVLAGVLFVLSLLSKGQAVAFAVSIIALDYVAGRKLTANLVIEKVPFFILSVIFGILAIYAQESSGSIASGTAWNIGHRILFACYGYVQYIIKLLVPIQLSAIYPYPRSNDPDVIKNFIVYPVFIFSIIAAFIYAHKRNRFIAFTILFFTINIFLLLQLLPVGKAIMADRYAYVASIGFFIFIAWLYIWGLNFVKKAGMAIRITMVLYLLAMSYLTYNRSIVWQTSLGLWEDVLKKFPDSEWALNNRGDILSNLNPPEYERALADFNRAIELDPSYDQTYYNRGVAKSNLARIKSSQMLGVGDTAQARKVATQFRLEAINDYNKALELRPEYPEAYSNRGATLFEMGKHREAIADFNAAISLKDGYITAISNRGSAKAMLANIEARDLYMRGMVDSAIIVKKKWLTDAIIDFNEVIKLQPENSKALYLRGMTNIELQNKESGCLDLNKAYELGYTPAEKEISKNCK